MRTARGVQRRFRFQSLTLRTEVPRALKPLLAPARYKAAYGGRGAAKSHFFAEQAVLRCYAAKARICCIREVQNSIKESVRQLIVDKIAKLELGEYFEVLENEIRGPEGSLIIFKGMQAYNAENIKSLEDYDVAWVEEAQTLSAKSLRLLRPTIRKAGSEIWFSWNPRYETDAVDAFFRGEEPPTNAVIVEVSWADNPWFPAVLKEEKDLDYQRDPEMADHVWGGGYEIISEGAYYARLIAAAESEGRVGDFPYNPALPVQTSWDIGVDDYTAVWFWQEDGNWATVIDYFEYSGYGAQDIVPHCMPELNPDRRLLLAGLVEIGRPQQWRYAEHFLPHDVKNREWGAGGRQRAMVLSDLGLVKIRVGVAVPPVDRVEAVRALLPVVRFNHTKRVKVGLSRLRRYSRKMNDQLGTYTTPLHDMNSHGADAFGEYAINSRIQLAKPKKDAQPQQPKGSVKLLGAPEPMSRTRIKL